MRDAVRQMCRKLDIVWSEAAYRSVECKTDPKSVIGVYLSKVDTLDNAGNSYDDTLRSEGTMWTWGDDKPRKDIEIMDCCRMRGNERGTSYPEVSAKCMGNRG